MTTQPTKEELRRIKSREYYQRRMADPEQKAAAAERSRKWREEHREESREYINAYMREYNKKRVAKQKVDKAEEKRLKELAKIEQMRKALDAKETELTKSQQKYRDQVEKAKKLLVDTQEG